MSKNNTPMRIGMNLENVVDWSPAWTFKDLFQASRPWISQIFNSDTFSVSFDPALAPKLDVDADGNVRSLQRFRRDGVKLQQFAGTLMFRDTGDPYPAGIYVAEWDGKGVVTFGFDAEVIASGISRNGRNFARLRVSPSQGGIYMRIEETDPRDPVRDFNLWMPDYEGETFVGQRWQPGDSFSPFHPLFLERLAPFKTLRFMGMQESNSSDIVTWSQRRDMEAIRQGSGAEGTPSEPLVNGVAVELMVQLANDLDADPWFNMPYKANDSFVRNFATYVRDNLEPGRKVYVEWANEVWNFGFGFEASHWASRQARKQGLDPDLGTWIVAGREAKRDMQIWSEVFSDEEDLELVRVAAGWAAVPFVTDQIARNMDGNFDAIAIAPYITPTDEQRARYSAATSVNAVLRDSRANIRTSAQWVQEHKQLATDWSQQLGRPIELVAYEGGDHLDGRNEPYQEAFYEASNHPEMGKIYSRYLKALERAGLDLYLDFQFTGQNIISPFGAFGKLHAMDQPLRTAHRFRALLEAVDRARQPLTPPPSRRGLPAGSAQPQLRHQPLPDLPDPGTTPGRSVPESSGSVLPCGSQPHRLGRDPLIDAAPHHRTDPELDHPIGLQPQPRTAREAGSIHGHDSAEAIGGRQAVVKTPLEALAAQPAAGMGIATSAPWQGACDGDWPAAASLQAWPAAMI